MLKEFKEFALKGNVVDLAVAVVIGGAFGKIVSSLVDSIIMPLVGILIGGIDFSSLSLTIGNASIKYGEFIQSVIDFLIISFAIFLFIKLTGSFFKKKKEEEHDKEPKLTPSEKYLEEIRDLLKNNTN
ncbi:large conductance mechanosensitive channel protein MscL [Sporanaerobacter sp. PP17-6a]|jgi:large conductance mechanosensitive channel|uniref:large conductance mechanosensitive channel protein MscL n=1 Tax=Sporanaerobacter sp. PP17-6a TaxID=1891289 RepID=UPI0008A091C7|nr:large conductance mechanosensitive channel protein MscL [Tissierellaceae bacterium]SCL86570.1 Large-conductance mechanosensitive channel [Sporanaerobacter sp. PP17-6a]